MVGQFRPSGDYNSPEVKEGKEEESIDLREIPIGSVIRFLGSHPASNYTARLVDGEQIKIWANPKNEGVIGSVDGLVSFKDHSDLLDGTYEKGVLRKDYHFGIPVFWYNKDKKVELGKQRVECYNKIYLQEN